VRTRVSLEGHGFSRAVNDTAIAGFRWDETAGLAEELSFPKRTRGAKGDQP
jgi:hypothetical protein